MPVVRRPDKGGGGPSRQDLEREAAKDLQRAGGKAGPPPASPGGWTPPAPGQPIIGDDPRPDEERYEEDRDQDDPEQEGEAVTELARSWLAEQDRPGRRQPAGDFAVRVDPASASAMRDRALQEHLERHERLRQELPTAPWNQKRLTIGKPFSTRSQPLAETGAAPPGKKAKKATAKKATAKKATAKKAKKAARAAKAAAPSPEPLPIENYDSLTTAQIVAALDDLDDDELEMVAAYEEQHRNRAGILGAIDDLFAEAPEAPSGPDAGLPIEDYDSLTTAQIVSVLDDLDDDELEMVAAYEEQHRNRPEVLDAIDDLFDEPLPPPDTVEKAAKKKAPAKKSAAKKKAAKKSAAKKSAKKKSPAKKSAAAKKKEASATATGWPRSG